MPAVKTAISIDENLFRDVDRLARQMEVSRSRIFVKAVEEFVQRHRNRELLERINAECAGEEDGNETERVARAKPRHRRLVEGQW